MPHLPAPPLTQGIGVILNKNNKNCIARCNAHAALGVSTGVARTPAKNRRRAGVGNSVVGLKDGARVPCFYSVGDFTKKTSARARKQHIDWL